MVNKPECRLVAPSGETCNPDGKLTCPDTCLLLQGTKYWEVPAHRGANLRLFRSATVKIEHAADVYCPYAVLIRSRVARLRDRDPLNRNRPTRKRRLGS
jgi:hypothetical protein